ncbi:G-protein coupled receptor protein [Emericellopsis atlantica]|uniref:G-protein coupled receptor protein n=1 Tax=Emericellopsis atlantica TaxID=2614577 RepID=A0A9P7ZMH2_9HYPO|nr:G-protein coupled receptor protein [Emericellopsis atlantica]KAG9254844.1 G-protein coupled receptor protein [Emericellopsis atlantica]
MSTEHEHTEDGAHAHVLKTPLWMLVIRGFQILISLIIVALAGRLMHDAYLDEEGLALAISLITWVVVAYVVLTEKLPALHKAYHIIAVLALEGFMVIMWLATFAAVAAERARYVVRVQTYGCFDNGSFLDSKTCLTRRDDNVLLFKSGAAMLAAIAGLGALMWLLFIATFAWTMVMFFRGRKEGRFLFSTGTTNEHQMESQPHMHPAGQPEKIVQSPLQPQAQYPQQQPAGYYQPQPGMQPQHEQYAQQAYQPSLSSQAVSPPPQQPQGPYQPPTHELHGQQQQPYGQYQQYPPPSGQQQPGYPQQSPPQNYTPANELEGGQHGQHYEMPSPPPASPPPAQQH